MKTSVHTVHTTDQDNDQESHSLSTTSTWKFWSFLVYSKHCAKTSLGFHVRICKKKPSKKVKLYNSTLFCQKTGFQRLGSALKMPPPPQIPQGLL